MNHSNDEMRLSDSVTHLQLAVSKTLTGPSVFTFFSCRIVVLFSNSILLNYHRKKDNPTAVKTRVLQLSVFCHDYSCSIYRKTLLVNLQNVQRVVMIVNHVQAFASIDLHAFGGPALPEQYGQRLNATRSLCIHLWLMLKKQHGTQVILASYLNDGGKKSILSRVGEKHYRGRGDSPPSVCKISTEMLNNNAESGDRGQDPWFSFASYFQLRQL